MKRITIFIGLILFSSIPCIGRYYDPTIGRFLIPDPLTGKYPSISPYVYCLNNPLRLVDVNGLEPTAPRITTVAGLIEFAGKTINNSTGFSNINKVMQDKIFALDLQFKGNTENSYSRYFYSKKYDTWVDGLHFFTAARYTKLYGADITSQLGNLKEQQQNIIKGLMKLGIGKNDQRFSRGAGSFNSYEDILSNQLGILFGSLYGDSNTPEEYLKNLQQFLQDIDTITDEGELSTQSENDKLPNKERLNPPQKTYDEAKKEHPELF